MAKILHKLINHEPPWRCYYIVRNSTRLLIEGRMDFTIYRRQLIDWGIRILLVDVPWKLNCQTINEGFFRKFFNDYSRNQLGLIRCVKRS